MFMAKRTDLEKNYVPKFHGEHRDIWNAKDDIIKAVGNVKGKVVADLGAGSGLFMPGLAEAVGDDGKLIALDISPGFVEMLKEKSADYSNVDSLLCTDTRLPFKAEMVDVVFVSDVYHHYLYPDTMNK